jgi:hypothetical protein
MIRWTLLALLGVVIAAVAAYAANQLATQPVGLSAEPITAGDRLAPPPRRTPTSTAVPTATPTAVPTADDDDDSGRGRGRGRGRGGDDDD